MVSSLRPQGRAEHQTGVPFRDSPVPPGRSAGSPTLGAVHGDDTEAGLNHQMRHANDPARPGTADPGSGSGAGRQVRGGVESDREPWRG